jgi:hypothetical protein
MRLQVGHSIVIFNDEENIGWSLPKRTWWHAMFVCVFELVGRYSSAAILAAGAMGLVRTMLRMVVVVVMVVVMVRLMVVAMKSSYAFMVGMRHAA